jgi:flavin-dependent dehydrogenase
MNKLDSISLLEVSRQFWDVIVVGAGPAGAMAAYELTHRSLRVLLVDKSAFPRPKVCGCCLNGQALALLQARGLESMISNLGAVPLRHLLLAAGGRRAILSLPAGLALSREALDMSLANAAVQKGVVFLSNTNATLDTPTPSVRQVILRSNGHQVLAKAAVVLAADGLNGSFSASWVAGAERREAPALDDMPGHRTLSSGHSVPKDGSAGESPSRNGYLPIVMKNSRIGAAVIVERGPAFYQSETIYMACGTGGYMGLVRLEDGRLNIAAALDSQALRAAGHAGRLATKILHEAGLPPVADILQRVWKGTPRLTRHASLLAAERIFVLGDAASFVEPFTGEGISWALRSAIAVAPLAVRAVQAWEPALEKEWTDTFHREVERRQIICRLTAGLLRWPRLTTMLIRLLAFLPSLCSPVLRQLNTRRQLRGGKFVTCRKELGQVENLPPPILGTGIPQ